MNAAEVMKAIDDELFDERAAIREFCGGLPRDLAEAMARWDVKEWAKQQEVKA